MYPKCLNTAHLYNKDKIQELDKIKRLLVEMVYFIGWYNWQVESVNELNWDHKIDKVLKFKLSEKAPLQKI